MRNALIWIGLVLALAVPCMAIVDKERVVQHGTVVLLKLAPVDPRSLMQGDFMRLRYELAVELAGRVDRPIADGLAIVSVNAQRVATLVRIGEADEALAPGEHALKFRKRGRFVRVSTDAFFFQEGHAKFYEAAEYGAFRVAESGDAVLTGMRDAQFAPLGPP